MVDLIPQDVLEAAVYGEILQPKNHRWAELVGRSLLAAHDPEHSAEFLISNLHKGYASKEVRRGLLNSLDEENAFSVIKHVCTFSPKDVSAKDVSILLDKIIDLRFAVRALDLLNGFDIPKKWVERINVAAANELHADEPIQLPAALTWLERNPELLLDDSNMLALLNLQGSTTWELQRELGRTVVSTRIEYAVDFLWEYAEPSEAHALMNYAIEREDKHTALHFLLMYVMFCGPAHVQSLSAPLRKLWKAHVAKFNLSNFDPRAFFGYELEETRQQMLASRRYSDVNSWPTVREAHVEAPDFLGVRFGLGMKLRALDKLQNPYDHSIFKGRSDTVRRKLAEWRVYIH